MLSRESELVAAFCREVLLLENAKLAEEYYYQSLSLCVIDAVFSIGVKYEAVRNTVIKYCDYFELSKTRQTAGYPEHEAQESIDSFITKLEAAGTEQFARNVVRNQQRTSSVNGILKAEAVLLFSHVLRSYEVQYFQDITKIVQSEAFQADIKKIPGQKSGISLVYFFMLAGQDRWIKPDRMIIRFLEKVLNRIVTLEEAQTLLAQASNLLSLEYANMTPRLLDNQIWSYTRQWTR